MSEFVEIKCNRVGVDLVLFEDAFFDEVLVGVVDHIFDMECARLLCVEFE